MFEMLVKVFRHSLLLYLLIKVIGYNCQELEEGSVRYGPLGIQIAFDPREGPVAWFYVAEKKFGFDEAVLACRGISNSLLVSYINHMFEMSDLVEVECGKSDDDLGDCDFDAKRTNKYINVTCLQDSVVEGAIAGQLEDNRVLVRVLQREKFVWGHVCVDDMNNGFDNVSADLFCSDLEHDSARKGEMGSLDLGSEAIIPIEFTSCDGTDSLNECSLSVSSDGSCTDNSVVSVQCERKIPTLETNIVDNIHLLTSQSQPYPSTDTTVAAAQPTDLTYLDLLTNKWFITGVIVSVAFIWVLLLIGLVCVYFCIKKCRKKRFVVNTQYLTEAQIVGAFNRKGNSNHYNTPETIFTNTLALSNEDAMHTVIFRSLRYHLGEEACSETVYQIPDDSYYDALLYGPGNIVPSTEERISNSFKVVDSWDDNEPSGYLIPNSNRPCFADKNSLEFWTPHDTIKGIFDQMSKRHFREILIAELTCDIKLGEGNFGYVYRGTWKSPTGCIPVPVAIKSIKSEEDESNFRFLKEAAIMGQFDHANVLKLLGVVTLSHPNMMVTELMYIGLKQFLENSDKSGSVKYDLFAPLFLNFSLDIANGMQHLSSKLYVHRDIAARNILLSHNLSCKIGDFGLARRTRIEDEYYLSSGGLIPYKWTAPEGICYNKYSEKSDVWSYGITLYEIWSVGGEPWRNLLPEEVSKIILLFSVTIKRPHID